MEEETELFSIDYNGDGSKFVTAGRDTILRLYDETTKRLVSNMRGKYGSSSMSSIFNEPGHSNRVFSVKFWPIDNNIIFSGTKLAYCFLHYVYPVISF